MDCVVVVIAAPGSRAIDGSVLNTLRRHGAGEYRWLAEAEALETRNFDGAAGFRAEIAALPLDVAVLATANRRKLLLIADMDSTMIQQECIDEMGEIAGVGDAIREVTASAMQGELDFAEALRYRMRLLKGLDAHAIRKILNERITYTPGGATLVATMKASGARTALVSGGFRQFTSAVAARLGFDLDEANDLVIGEDGRLTGEVREPIFGKEAKLAALLRLAAKGRFDAADALAVGDGANDLPMLMAAGMGVALHAKPSVRAAAPIAIDHGDLTALLYLQGYAKQEFVTA